jgi:transposase InsO family protein
MADAFEGDALLEVCVERHRSCRMTCLLEDVDPAVFLPGDMTYIPTREGWLYLAVVLDLFSRRIVGWSMGAAIDSALACRALDMAWHSRLPASGLIFHSDRGRQYASCRYAELLAEHGIKASMSGRATAFRSIGRLRNPLGPRSSAGVKRMPTMLQVRLRIESTDQLTRFAVSDPKQECFRMTISLSLIFRSIQGLFLNSSSL